MESEYFFWEVLGKTGMFCKHIELKLLSIRRFVMSLAMFFLWEQWRKKKKNILSRFLTFCQRPPALNVIIVIGIVYTKRNGGGIIA